MFRDQIKERSSDEEESSDDDGDGDSASLDTEDREL